MHFEKVNACQSLRHYFFFLVCLCMCLVLVQRNRKTISVNIYFVFEVEQLSINGIVAHFGLWDSRKTSSATHIYCPSMLHLLLHVFRCTADADKVSNCKTTHFVYFLTKRQTVKHHLIAWQCSKSKNYLNGIATQWSWEMVC